jgi:hypothetical protein
MPVNEDQALLRELTEAVVETILASAGPGAGSSQTIVELRMLGGALARVVDGRPDAQFRGIRRSRQASAVLHR